MDSVDRPRNVDIWHIMRLSHFLFLLLIIVIWGLNFIFAKFCLNEMPPFLLCSLRFLLASVPIIFFIKPPTMPLRMLISYGLVMFFIQFGLLFLSLAVGMTPGMASLLMQVQVFFSIFFGVIFLGEILRPSQILGATIAFSGVGLVGFHFDQSISIIGFVLVLLAAATWGIGNLISKKNSNINMFALVIWGNFIAFAPMLLMSLYFEGYNNIVNSIHNLSLLSVSSLLYIVYCSTWVGYGGWNWLLSRYPMNTIVPYALLTPLVGLLGSVLILGEPFQLWKLEASLLVLIGLGINGAGGFLFSLKSSKVAN